RSLTLKLRTILCADGTHFHSNGEPVSPMTYPLLPFKPPRLAILIWPLGDPACFFSTTTPATPLGMYFALLFEIPWLLCASLHCMVFPASGAAQRTFALPTS